MKLYHCANCGLRGLGWRPDGSGLIKSAMAAACYREAYLVYGGY